MTVAVLLMAYGTPASPDEVEAYYTDIRRGRPPTPEQLADLVRRYDAIGGLSPLNERTEAQRSALEKARVADLRVELGMKHADPRIEDAVARLVADGVERIVGLVLAPHYSAASVGQYLERARAAAGPTDVVGIESWHVEPAYLDFLATAVRTDLARLPARTHVVFTAHSLPQRVADAGDPYPEQLRETAEAVAARARLADWSVGYQSAGRTPEPWLGPDILDVVRSVDADGVLVCPCGFTSDHLEVLYDLDVEAKGVADSVGKAFARTAVVNDDPAVMAALAQRVRTAG